jgi:hypothetical protein
MKNGKDYKTYQWVEKCHKEYETSLRRLRKGVKINKNIRKGDFIYCIETDFHEVFHFEKGKRYKVKRAWLDEEDDTEVSFMIYKNHRGVCDMDYCPCRGRYYYATDTFRIDRKMSQESRKPSFTMDEIESSQSMPDVNTVAEEIKEFV